MAAKRPKRESVAKAIASVRFRPMDPCRAPPKRVDGEMRRFEMKGKFWSIGHAGKSVVITAGRVGTSGRTQFVRCASPGAAAREVAKRIDEKTAEGYREMSTEAL